jgi:photosystem II CP43 chlorophyll apoprotein
MDNLEDIIYGHAWLGCIWQNLAYLNQTLCMGSSAFAWSGEDYLSYSLGALSVFDFMACCFVWFSNMA